MPPTKPARFRRCDSSPSDVCLGNFRNEDGFDADGLSLDTVRTILCIVTDLLAPAYIVLSFVAIASRYNSFLKLLASHGKTSTTKRKTEARTKPKPKARSDSNERTGENALASKSRTSRCWVSKRYFSHFYVVGLLSTGIATAVCLRNNERHSGHVPRDGSSLPYSRNAAAVLLVVHLLRRAYECVCVQQHTKESSKMHVAGYALGVGYYLVLPLVFWEIGDTAATVSAISGVANNSSSRSISSSSSTNNNIDFDALLSVSESFGSATSATNIFLGVMIGVNLWLQYEQHVHHDILASMRRTKPKDNKDGDNDKHATNRGDENSDANADANADADANRKLPCNHNNNNNNNNNSTPRHYSLPPYRRWFRYVLSPHYLAEILLYASFAVLLEAEAPPAAAWEEQNPQEAPPPMAEGTCAAYTNTCTHTHTHGGWLRSALPLLSSGRANRHWALLVWVATNLTVSALNTHDWYRSGECQTTTDAITTTASNDPLATNETRDSRKAIVPLLL